MFPSCSKIDGFVKNQFLCCAALLFKFDLEAIGCYLFQRSIVMFFDKVKVDGFVKSPISLLRFILYNCGID